MLILFAINPLQWAVLNAADYFPYSSLVFGRPRRRRVDNIKMDLRETGWGAMDWIDLAQDKDQWRTHVNTGMILWVL
jgi:hypothetical protein